MVNKASRKVYTLDIATQLQLAKIERKDRRYRMWATVAFGILFTVGILGIYYQNTLAQQNKTHIDCIVKLLATPIPVGKSQKVIVDALGTCNIRTTP